MKDLTDWLHAAMESLPEAFWIMRGIRDANGEIVDFEYVYVNAAALQFFDAPPGAPRDALIGTRIRSSYQHESQDGDSTFERFCEAMHTQQVIEYEYRRNSESPGWNYQQIVPLPDGVAVLNMDITSRKALEEAERQQSQIIAASAERQRLARELHDSVTQTLFSASMVAQTLPHLWKRGEDAVKNGLADLARLTLGALAEMRTMLLELRPAALNTADLGELMTFLLNALAAHTIISTSLTLEGSATLPPDVQLTFYRVAQESLNNVAKHAKAKHVEVTLRRETGYAELTISDDGRGFDPLRVSADHFGLQIMRERAETIGAAFTVNSAPAEGTHIQLIWKT
jgi:signal transduction histidine kinase